MKRWVLGLAVLPIAACSDATRTTVGVVLTTDLLVSPSRGGLANTARPTIRWRHAPQASNYEVRVLVNGIAQPLARESDATENRAVLAADLADASVATVELEAFDAAGHRVGLDRAHFRVRHVPDWMPRIALTRNVPARAYGGYRLFNLIDIRPPFPDHRVACLVLVNGAGEIVWWLQRPDATDLMAASVLPNGNLLFIHRHVTQALTVTAYAVESGWAGNEVWRSSPDTLVHHDAGTGPDQTRMLLTWVFQDAKGIRYEGDGIELVDPVTGGVLWTWNLFDYLDPNVHDVPESSDIGRSFLGRDWSHANAAVWDPARSLIWMSVRNFDTLLGIHYPSGKVEAVIGRLGAGGAGLLSHQHAPEIQPDGSILLFDNGNTRSPQESRVLHLAWHPADRRVEVQREWRDAPGFYDHSLGDADMLPNGNVLVCAGVSGRIFEIDPDGAIVWELTIEHGERPRWPYRAVQVPPERIPEWVFAFPPAR